MKLRYSVMIPDDPWRNVLEQLARDRCRYITVGQIYQLLGIEPPLYRKERES